MRISRITSSMAALLLMASPMVFAQDNSEAPVSDDPMTQMADRLDDPATQDDLAAMIEKMAGALMALPVGGLVGAMEDARPGSVKDDIPADATLADLAGEDAGDMPEKMAKQSRVAMGMMGGFAKIFATMMPKFKDMARDMGTDMERVD